MAVTIKEAKATVESLQNLLENITRLRKAERNDNETARLANQLVDRADTNLPFNMIMESVEACLKKEISRIEGIIDSREVEI